jgi:hypothetical protein
VAPLKITLMTIKKLFNQEKVVWSRESFSILIIRFKSYYNIRKKRLLYKTLEKT